MRNGDDTRATLWVPPSKAGKLPKQPTKTRTETKTIPDLPPTFVDSLVSRVWTKVKHPTLLLELESRQNWRARKNERTERPFGEESVDFTFGIHD